MNKVNHLFPNFAPMNDLREIVATLPVMESFYTLQGEGFHQGKAAYFVRLGGCDVGCSWCDVKESWDESKHPIRKITDIISEIEVGSLSTGKSPIVVVTGGEPLMHDLKDLTSQLRSNGFKTHIETSGAYSLSGEWDWICLSPKKFKAPLPEVIPHANELKVVIYNKSDFAWAERYAALVSASCMLYLQPEWEKASEMTPLIIDYIKAHPQWELSLQIHKYINVP